MSKSIVPAGFENDVDIAIDHGLRAGRMLTFSFIGATVMYVVVGILLASSSQEATAVLPWQQAGLLLLAITAAAVALLWLPSLYSVERTVAKRGNVTVADAVQQQLNGFAIGMVAIEVVALAGLIATFLTRNFQYVLIYSVYGVAMQLLLLVRRSEALRDARPTLQQLAEQQLAEATQSGDM